MSKDGKEKSVVKKGALFVGDRIASISRQTARKPALLTVAIDDDLAAKLLADQLPMMRNSFADPGIRGLMLEWKDHSEGDK